MIVKIKCGCDNVLVIVSETVMEDIKTINVLPCPRCLLATEQMKEGAIAIKKAQPGIQFMAKLERDAFAKDIQEAKNDVQQARRDGFNDGIKEVLCEMKQLIQDYE